MKKIAEAVNAIGGQVALAKLLDVHPTLISQWVTGRLEVGARHVLSIESATGVSRHDLRPDIFGPAPTAAQPGEGEQEARESPTTVKQKRAA